MSWEDVNWKDALLTRVKQLLLLGPTTEFTTVPMTNSVSTYTDLVACRDRFYTYGYKDKSLHREIYPSGQVSDVWKVSPYVFTAVNGGVGEVRFGPWGTYRVLSPEIELPSWVSSLPDLSCAHELPSFETEERYWSIVLNNHTCPVPKDNLKYVYRSNNSTFMVRSENGKFLPWTTYYVYHGKPVYIRHPEYGSFAGRYFFKGRNATDVVTGKTFEFSFPEHVEAAVFYQWKYYLFVRGHSGLSLWSS